MKVQVSGTRNGAGDLDKSGQLVSPAVEWPPLGGEIDVGEAEGADLIASGMAVEVKVEPKAEKKAVDTDPKPVVETATVEEKEPEKATGLTTGNGPVKRGPGRPRKNV